jgi:hypothetical protein
MKRRWIKGGLVTCIVLGICTFRAAPAQEQGGEKGGKPRLAREARPSESPAARTNNLKPQPTAPASAAGSVFDGKLVALTLRGATQGVTSAGDNASCHSANGGKSSLPHGSVHRNI